MGSTLCSFALGLNNQAPLRNVKIKIRDVLCVMFIYTCGEKIKAGNQ
jgi:hypothetical protein